MVMSVAESVARKAAADWPGIDAEDIQQELLMRACMRPADYNAMDEAACTSALAKEAAAYCARERSDYITRTARYLYTPREVRALLAIAVQTLATWDTPTRDGYVAAPDAGNVVVSLWDLKAALDTLPSEWRAVLVRQAEGDTYTREQRREAIAQGWAPVGRSERERYRRALARLTNTLNRAVNHPRRNHEGPGSRAVISNARAHALTRATESGA